MMEERRAFELNDKEELYILKRRFRTKKEEEINFKL